MCHMLVILYVFDALRADHLSCYGYGRKTTPNIDDFSEDSVLFANAFTQSTWTRTSAASMLSSKYPRQIGVSHVEDAIPTGVVCLPGIMQRLGYSTKGVSGMVNVCSVFGFDEGFDEFVDLFELPSKVADPKGKSTMVSEKAKWSGQEEVVFPRASDVNSFLSKWIGENGANDMFLFAWTMDTHIPFNPPRGWRVFGESKGQDGITRKDLRGSWNKEKRERVIDLYDDEILYADSCFGVFLQHLKKLGRYDDSLIFVTSDHGQLFLEHGEVGHGHIPYDEVIRVPLIVKFPNSRFKGKNQQLVQLIDVFPTILEILEADRFTETLDLEGRSVIPLLEKKVESINRYVYSDTHFSELQATFYSIRSLRWKYIHVVPPRLNLSFLGEFFKHLITPQNALELLSSPEYFIHRVAKKDREFLFDLSKDRPEANNIAGEDENQLLIFRRELQRWRALQENRDIRGRKVELSDAEKMKARLRELGYL